MPVSDLEIVASNSAPPSRELETAEHRIIDVGRLCAAQLGLRCKNGAYGLQTFSERQLVRS
jgi:hypothetical protein